MYQKEITILGFGRLFKTDKYVFREVSFTYDDQFTEGVKCACIPIFGNAVSTLKLGDVRSSLLNFEKVDRGNGKYNLVLKSVYLL